MQTVTLEEAQAHLPELLGVLEPGDELTIVAGGQTLAQVKKARPETRGSHLQRTAVKNGTESDDLESSLDSSWIDEEFMESCVTDSNPDVSLDDVRARLSKIEGSLDDAINETRGEW